MGYHMIGQYRIAWADEDIPLISLIRKEKEGTYLNDEMP